MIRTTPSIRAIALDEFNRRLAQWRKACRDGAADWPGDRANKVINRWLAIALAAGVGRDLPHDVCASIEVACLFPQGKRYLPSAEHFCRTFGVSWQAALAELAAERDRLRARAEGSKDQRLIQRALDLTHLADVLGAPPVTTPASFEAREAA